MSGLLMLAPGTHHPSPPAAQLLNLKRSCDAHVYTARMKWKLSTQNQIPVPLSQQMTLFLRSLRWAVSPGNGDLYYYVVVRQLYYH